ncbi:hypothetical protein BG000_006515, partial [Podila horticola]
MAEQISSAYPIPTYRYMVTVDGDDMAFSSVSGLEMGFETIEYKDGTGNWFQMPGQRDQLNISRKKDISISLTDESGSNLLVTWNIIDAFPTKLSAPNFDAS